VEIAGLNQEVSAGLAVAPSDTLIGRAPITKAEENDYKPIRS